MAKSKSIKIILDVNWLISASINASSRKKFEALLLNERFIFCVCVQLLNEYDDVIKRPVFSNKIKPAEIAEFRNIFLERSEVFGISIIKKVVRDVKDDYLIALAKKSKADFLITGDKDLLVLKKTGKTEITTLSDFLQRFFSPK